MLEINIQSLKIGEKEILKDVYLKTENIISLQGKSGCGKSTLLSFISGNLEGFTAIGEVLLNGVNITNLPNYQRKIGILFQDDLLFPHLNIWQNVGFAISQNKKQTAKIALDSVGLGYLANSMPNMLSGGERARISMLRMLQSKPNAVLLDEPFSKLDSKSRAEFRAFVFSHIKEIPAILVSHDKEDLKGLVLEYPNWNMQNNVNDK